MKPIIRFFVALVVIVLPAALAAAPARAHSDFLGGDPADGTNVEGPVDTIELHYAVAIDVESSTFEVIRVVAGEAETLEVADVSSTNNLDIVLTLAEPVFDGAVGVSFTVVSLDTHVITDSFSFGVVAPPPNPTPVATATPQPTTPPDPEPTAETIAPTTAATATPSPTPDPTPTVAAGVVPAPVDSQPPPPDLTEFFSSVQETDRLLRAQTILRGLAYASAAIALGTLVFLLVIADERADYRMVRRVSAGAAALTMVLTVGLVATQSALTLGGQTGKLFDSTGWELALRGNFRTAVLLRVVSAALILITVARPLPAWGPGRRSLATGAAVVAVVAFPFFGHGVTRNPQWLVFPSDLIHVAAVSFWTGGLLALVLVLRARPDSGGRGMVGRYSTAAGVALAATLLAGTILAATELDGPSALVNTSYGVRLIVKLLLVGIIVAMGAYNHFRTVPEAVSTDGATATAGRSHLMRFGLVEVAVMVSVLVFSAWLVDAAT